MKKTILNLTNVKNSYKTTFESEKEFFSYFVSEINGQKFKDCYEKFYERTVDGQKEVYIKTVIPKKDKTAMLNEIEEYVSYKQTGKSYYITGIKQHVA